jgi:hypothetical protein
MVTRVSALARGRGGGGGGSTSAVPFRVGAEERFSHRCRRLVAFFELDQEGGDVVDAAGLVGVVDEGLDGGLGGGGLAEDAFDLGVVEHVGEAVAAEEEAVTDAGGEGEVVDLDDHVDADGAGEDAAVGVGPGLRGGELALLDHAVDEGVVVGDLTERAVAQQVGAGVADVGEVDRLAVDEGGREGGAQAGDGAVEHRSLEDRAVRLLDQLREGALTALEQVLHRLDRQARRDLAPAMPAHAVGHDEERIHHEVRVLVALADVADVGRDGDDRPHRLSSRIVLPIFTTSPACTSTGAATRWSFRNVPFVEPRSSRYHPPSRAESFAWCWLAYVSSRRTVQASARPISSPPESL